jgi:hypothetical protein
MGDASQKGLELRRAMRIEGEGKQGDRGDVDETMARRDEAK